MHIYIPKKEIVVPSRLTTGVAGRIHWEVKRRDGSVRLSGDQKNLITDAGLDGLCAGESVQTMTGHCAVGTGTAEPSSADTEIAGAVSSSSRSGANVLVNTSTQPYYGRVRRSYTFSFGVATGNWTELGLRRNGTPAVLFARQLFRDPEGNPISVTVLEDEQLIVRWDVFRYAFDGDFAQNGATIEGVGDVDLLSRPLGMVHPPQSSQFWGEEQETVNTSWRASVAGNQNFRDVTANRTGDADSGRTRRVYVPGSFVRQVEYVWNPNNGNGTVGMVCFGHGAISGAYQTLIDPPFAKTSDYRLRLEFEHGFSRYEPEE